MFNMKQILLIIISYCVLLYGCTNTSDKFTQIALSPKFEMYIPCPDDSIISQMTACVDNTGNTHVILSDNGMYLRIDSNGKIRKQTRLTGTVDSLLLPNDIQIFDEYIAITDIANRTIIFFDKDLKLKYAFKLLRYPFKFRMIDKNHIYYMTDYIDKISKSEMNYSFRIFCQNLLNGRENEIYIGESVNLIKLRKSLNLNDPKTIDFDVDPRNQDVYCIRNSWDQFIVTKTKKRKTKKVIENDTWKPILYTSQEKTEKLNYLKQTTLRNYPLENTALDYKIAVNSIKLDTIGNIWLVCSADIGNMIRIYSNDRKSYCELPLPNYEDAKLSITGKYLLIYNVDIPTGKPKLSLFEYKLE